MQTSNMATGVEESETPSRNNVHPKAHTTTPHEICDSNQGANLLLELKRPPLHYPTPEASREKAGGGRKPKLIGELYKILQNDEFPYANWVKCFSEQGGQNFTILNNKKSIGEVMESVGCKSGNFLSLRRNLRNYEIYTQDSPNSEKAVLMFACYCPFKSESSTEDIQKVIAMQTEKRKRKIEETNRESESLEDAAYTTLSYKTYTGGLNGSQSESVTKLSASRFKVPKVPE